MSPQPVSQLRKKKPLFPKTSSTRPGAQDTLLQLLFPPSALPSRYHPLSILNHGPSGLFKLRLPGYAFKRRLYGSRVASRRSSSQVSKLLFSLVLFHGFPARALHTLIILLSQAYRFNSSSFFYDRSKRKRSRGTLYFCLLLSTRLLAIQLSVCTNLSCSCCIMIQ